MIIIFLFNSKYIIFLSIASEMIESIQNLFIMFNA